MRKNHEIIKYIFSYKEISKDEKFIFFSILSIINEVNKDEVEVSIASLLDICNPIGKRKLLTILNSLETKGYFKIIKQTGPIGIGEAIATVDGKVAAKGELTFAIV